MRTAVTLCSGGGGSALGIQAAGVQLVGAVEHDAAIAAQYAANLGAHVTVAKVQDVDYRQFYGVDVLQESPPCPNFSNAKQGGVEGPDDLAIAAACCRAIREIRPRVFWLENVEGYAGSQSYRLIRATLDDLDYWSHAAVVNAADFGVAQTRRRLILRAVAGGLWQPFRPLPNAVPWVGWYAAVADLLDTLPETQPAPWQLKRLPADLFSVGVLLDSKNVNQEYGKLHRLAEEPAITVVTDDRPSHMPRAFLLKGDQSNQNGQPWHKTDQPCFSVTANQDRAPLRAFLLDTSTIGSDGGNIGVRDADIPAQTVRAGSNHQYRAFIIGGGNTSDASLAGTWHSGPRWADEPTFTVTQHSTTDRAWLTHGRWVKMTPRALARFQSFDDVYLLPDNNALACKCIGNAVPPLLSRRITESLLV